MTIDFPSTPDPIDIRFTPFTSESEPPFDPIDPGALMHAELIVYALTLQDDIRALQASLRASLEMTARLTGQLTRSTQAVQRMMNGPKGA